MSWTLTEPLLETIRSDDGLARRTDQIARALVAMKRVGSNRADFRETGAIRECRS